jgi:fatty acid desaturase
MNNDEDKELKQLWNKYSESASQSRLNQKEISAMVEQVIVHPFKKMRISIFSSVFCALCGCIYFAYIALEHWKDWRWLLASGLLIGGCIYAVGKRIADFRRLQQACKQSPEVILQTLHTSIAKMDRENRIHSVGIVLLVLCCICAVLLGGSYFGHLPSAAYGYVLTTILAAIVTGYAYARWHRKRFYQEPMERIQQAIHEIEHEN